MCMISVVWKETLAKLLGVNLVDLEVMVRLAFGVAFDGWLDYEASCVVAEKNSMRLFAMQKAIKRREADGRKKKYILQVAWTSRSFPYRYCMYKQFITPSICRI
jgi:hypothetical protein